MQEGRKANVDTNTHPSCPAPLFGFKIWLGEFAKLMVRVSQVCTKSELRALNFY